MKIYWRGRGILAFIIPFVLILIPTIIGKDNQFFASIMATLAGIIVFGIGRKWNAKESTFEFTQNESSSKINIPRHSLFWVAMEYWGILFLLFGLASFINEAFTLNYLEPIQGICIIGLLIMMFINRRREKNYLKKIKEESSGNTVNDKFGFKRDLAKNSNETLSNNSNQSGTNNKHMTENSERQKMFEELRKKEKIYKPSNHDDYIPR